MINTKENKQYIGITDYESWLNSAEANTLAEMYMQENREDTQADIDVDFNMPFLMRKQ